MSSRAEKFPVVIAMASIHVQPHGELQKRPRTSPNDTGPPHAAQRGLTCRVEKEKAARGASNSTRAAPVRQYDREERPAGGSRLETTATPLVAWGHGKQRRRRLANTGILARGNSYTGPLLTPQTVRRCVASAPEGLRHCDVGRGRKLVEASLPPRHGDIRASGEVDDGVKTAKSSDNLAGCSEFCPHESNLLSKYEMDKVSNEKIVSLTNRRQHNALKMRNFSGQKNVSLRGYREPPIQNPVRRGVQQSSTEVG